jgi:hypothetical protein
MYRRLLLLCLVVAVTLGFRSAHAATVTVSANGPYEVWAGNSLIPDKTVVWEGQVITMPGYYDAPNAGYTLLGISNTTASFSGNYTYFVVGTRSLFSLDAVQIGPNAMQWSDTIMTGNVHRPWQYDSSGNLVGTIMDYADETNIYGLPDGLTNDVGLPHGGVVGGPFEGFVAVSAVPAPAPVWLFGAGLLTLLGRRKRIARRVARAPCT